MGEGGKEGGGREGGREGEGEGGREGRKEGGRERGRGRWREREGRGRVVEGKTEGGAHSQGVHKDNKHYTLATNIR